LLIGAAIVGGTLGSRLAAKNKGRIFVHILEPILVHAILCVTDKNYFEDT
jgi:hypothetical protein